MSNFLESYIRLIVEEEFKTKKGKSFEIKVTEDSEGDENRGWIVHKFDAIMDGKIVGYLKVSYIPEKRFQSQYKTIYDYIDKITGNLIPKDWSDRKYALNRLAYSILGWPGLDQIDPPLESLNDEELDVWEEKINQKAIEKYQKEFDEFKNYHVNKPLVDYIRVEDEHRRQRIAAALYEFAAKWLSKKGMKLYASGLQSEEAKGAWKWLEANKAANIGTEKVTGHGKKITRTFLSYL